MASSDFRLCAVSLDDSFSRPTNSAHRHEKDVAIFDLIDSNSFAPVDHSGGPYRLALALVEKRLMVSVTTEKGAYVLCHYLSLTPFRQILKDYALVSDSYADAKARLSPERLEAIDMGRRAIHYEAADLLRERLRSKIIIDQETARHLFTLLSLLLTRKSFDQG
ncbi:MAG: UPF0262 family protein [Mesorhizobium sp.]|nr:MAG: UPF0262 family protein [Mesorhizobium sp.]